jgi:hypothetical protein
MNTTPMNATPMETEVLLYTLGRSQAGVAAAAKAQAQNWERRDPSCIVHDHGTKLETQADDAPDKPSYRAFVVVSYCPSS